MNAQHKPSPKVIATRKACRADGIGLSHFVLMTPPLGAARPRPKAAKPAAKA
jgi:modified peptide precursor CbpA